MSVRLCAEVAALAQTYPGPGGACAVLRNGELLAGHTWGFANAERRLPFTPQTLFRMCSITKQFTCALVLDAFPDPTVLDADIRDRLKLLETTAPGALHLCHNQSGLRDYWAVAMLHGSPAEGPFGDTEAARIIGGTRTLQFAPGTRYAYCNQNFRLLSDILQDRAGNGFADLLRTRILTRAGMETAFLAADTSKMPDDTVGYEGTQAAGFRPAINRIVWTGDAGLGASLNDMIAWERHIDATRDDPQAPYTRLCAPVAFADGVDAAYGFGVSRATHFGRRVTFHGGALRGWRSHRLYVPSDRISVVVMFNHMSDAHEAALSLLAAVLGEAAPPTAVPPATNQTVAYVEPETQLSARIDVEAGNKIRLRYAHPAEYLELQPDGSAFSDSVRLRPVSGTLSMDRTLSHQSSLLQRLEGGPTLDATGLYHCAELDAALTVTDAGGTLYGGFSGFLGQGRMERLDHVGANTWALPCPRALDHAPPGDWTLRFSADAPGKADRVEIGCFIARRLTYLRKFGN